MPKLFQIDAFTGEANTVNPKRMPKGAMQSSKNIDIDDTGSAIGRNGYALVRALANWQYAYAASWQSLAVIIDNGDLYRLNADLTLHLLKSSVLYSNVSQTEIGNELFLTNGIITDGYTVRDLRVPNPLSPTVSIISGNLPAGQYQLVCTHTDTTGRESGISELVVVDLLDNQGLLVTPSNAGYQVNTYISLADSADLFLAGVGNITLTEPITSRYVLPTHLIGCYPCPENIGKIVYYESKIYVSVYDSISGVTIVFYSQPFQYHLFALDTDYFIMSSKIEMLLAANSGLVIGTDIDINAYTSDGGLVPLANYGVVAGECGVNTMDGNIEFWSRRGMCRALPFENLTQKTVSVKSGETCNVAHIEQNGYNKFLAITDTLGVSNNEAIGY